MGNDVGTEATVGKVRQQVRGVDPGLVSAPAYVVSIDSIKVDRAASMPRDVYSSVMFAHAYERVDKVRVGLDAQVQPSNGVAPTYPSSSVDCQIGEVIDGGRLGPLEYTREGHTYTRCLENPFRPTLAGAPMQLAPIAVHDGDTLNLFTALSVLDPADAWLHGSGADTSPRELLSNLGTGLSAAGAIVSVFPPGAAVSAALEVVGGIFSASSYLVNPMLDEIAHCAVTPSLVPGFGSGATPSDAVSPVLRTSLTGRQLFEATSQGDALIAYDLDFGVAPSSIMCQRPRTEITFRIRRVPMEGDPGGWMRARSSTIVSSEPNQIDAFGLGAPTVVHDARGYDAKYPLAFAAPGDLSALRWVTPNPYVLPDPCAAGSATVIAASTKTVSAAAGTTGGKGGGCWLPIFGAGANVAALTRKPNEIDLYAVDRDGDLEWTTRDLATSPVWNDWRKVSSGGLFPPGAPVSAVSRSNHVADVVVVARDGSIQRLFQFDASFSSPMAITPRAKVQPFDGARFGGVVIVSFPSSDGVYAIGYDDRLLSAWGEPISSSWAYAEGFAAPDFHAPGGAGIAGVSRESNRLDLFVVDEAGILRTTRWTGELGWSRSADVMTSTSMPAPPGAPLAVVARKVDVTTVAVDPQSEETNNEQMNVFVVGTDGRIIDAHWRFGDNGYRWNVADAVTLSVVAAPGGAIGAVAPYAGVIFVAATRPDGTVVETWSDDLVAGVLDWQSMP